MKTFIAYILSFTYVILVAFLGQIFTKKGINSKWYKKNKPSITPPSIVFPIVWTILYIFISISFAKEIIQKNKITIILFIVNLILNISWCYIFFYMQNPVVALFNIFLILITIIGILHYTKINLTRYLIIPYLIWIGFAMILNVLSIN